MPGPGLDDYISFFEAEPEWIHPQGWFYGARFKTLRDGDELVVTIAPDEAELDAMWLQRGERKLSLVLKMVSGWQLERHGDSEYLIVRINTGPTAICGFDYCLFRLKPRIEVECQMTWGPGWPIPQSLKPPSKES
jgi:hypothetical protein